MGARDWEKTWGLRKFKGVHLDEGPGVTTKGISGLFTKYNPNKMETIKDAKILLLDTAGRNAPTLRTDKRSGVKALLKDVSAARSKERFLDDLILSISDTIIYVVDEMLNEDQRTIMNLIQTVSQGQQLIVVHNWKRQNCKEDIEKIRKLEIEQLEEPFGAVLETRDQGDKDVAPMWKSTWEMDANERGERKENIYTYHFILYNHDKCYDENRNTFKAIRSHSTKSQIVREKPLIIQFGQHSYEHVRNYIKPKVVKDTVGGRNSPRNTVHSEKQQKSDAIIKWEPKEGEEFTHVHWDLREMPKAQPGAWTPQHHDCPLHKDENEEVIGPALFRVSLPGLSEDDEIVSDEEQREREAKSESWWRVRDTAADTTRGHEFVVEGFRAKPNSDSEWFLDDRTATNTYGSFNVPFTHPLTHEFPSDPDLFMQFGDCVELIVRAEKKGSKMPRRRKKQKKKQRRDEL